MVNLDLAVEARDLVRGATGQEIPGVSEQKQDFPYGTVTIIKILDESAESVMGKPKGTYITIEAPGSPAQGARSPVRRRRYAGAATAQYFKNIQGSNRFNHRAGQLAGNTGRPGAYGGEILPDHSPLASTHA